MVILLSPAKKLDFSETTCTQESKPFFTKKTQEVLQVMQQKSAMEIADLMHLSKDLADLNFERYQKFKKNPEKQAVLAFDGEVYNGLQAHTWSEEMLLKAQEQLIILSGLYGFLKPLDKIKPYRLEMGTKLAIQNHKNLYEFWKNDVTQQLTQKVFKNNTIINLASTEYSLTIEPVFKEFKNGKYSTVMMYAKKARGLMAKFILENNIEIPEDIKTFDIENYAYNPHLSNENTWVFTR
jgi:cytoplasmic iron level regulating protein YaaA (DUF328/UPF0246 family)